MNCRSFTAESSEIFEKNVPFLPTIPCFFNCCPVFARSADGIFCRKHTYKEAPPELRLDAVFQKIKARTGVLPIRDEKSGALRKAHRTGCQKSPKDFFDNLPEKCKIDICNIILHFCRCGGLLNAKGNPDGSLSHYPSLRNLRLDRFFDSLSGALRKAHRRFVDLRA